MSRPLLVLIAIAALAWPAGAAAAPSNLSYPVNGSVATVSGNPSAFTLTLAHPFTFSGFPILTLDTDYEIASPQTLNLVSGACDETPDSGATSFRCEVPPSITNVTGSPQGDSISASCGIFFSSPRMSVQAGDGADTVTAACSADTLNGGPGDDGIDGGSGDDAVNGEAGDDSLAGGGGADTVTGGPGDDSIQAGSQDDTANGNDGADTVSGGDGTDHVLGESGRDALAGGAGDDLLEGGADRDTLDGGDGNDTLDGGDGRDLLIPGTGTDVARGGTSIDTVSYEDRADGVPLRISLNATADDGAPGENDAIEGDVENVIGSPGADTIVGNDGANDIDAGESNDTIDPLGGADFVDAGPGDDRVTARDGAQDRIECGPGVDTAVVDEFDVVAGCEAVDSSRELMADVDNDGVPAPADCDDRRPTIRPGIPDIPGNRVDDDCFGGDAAFPRIETPIQFSFRVRRRVTRITRLVVLDLPSESRIEVRCRGGKRRGCFKGVKRARVSRGSAKKAVSRFVRRRRFRPGARIEVRVVRPATVGKVLRIKVRRRKAPALSRRCLPPGARTPRRC